MTDVRLTIMGLMRMRDSAPLYSSTRRQLNAELCRRRARVYRIMNERGLGPRREGDPI